jgi:predicted nucleic acid-binding protein
VIEVLCDTSVVVKWFHERDEAEVVPSRAILEAHAAGRLTALVLDLTVHELGNVAARPLGLPGDRVAQILDRLELICDAGLPLSPAARRDAAELAVAHRLTFYDAAYWAVARERNITLVTADVELLKAGAGSSPADFVSAHDLQSGPGAGHLE